MRAGKLTFTARGKLDQCSPTVDAETFPRMNALGDAEMTDRSCFLTHIIWMGNSRYFLWKDGGEKPDRLLTDKNGVLINEGSKALAFQFSRSLNEDVDADDVRLFDFDRLWAILRSGRQGAIFSKSDYNSILEGWNLIEDLGRSLRIALIPQEERRSLIQGLYEQVFVCADVLDLAEREVASDVREKIVEVTPSWSLEGDGPKLTREKIGAILDFLEEAWKAVRADKGWKESR
jgi:hypothetical protein